MSDELAVTYDAGSQRELAMQPSSAVLNTSTASDIYIYIYIYFTVSRSRSSMLMCWTIVMIVVLYLSLTQYRTGVKKDCISNRSKHMSRCVVTDFTLLLD